jgi:hypothetical protein
MAESFFDLSADDRKEALAVAASSSGRPAYLLETDAWVVWALAALFRSPFAKHLVFNGGTSLSKAYKAIDRFSEDIDVTYDIRAIAGDLVEGAGADAVPSSKSQAKSWRDAIDKRIPKWLNNEVLPYIQRCLESEKLEARTRIDGHSICIDYTTQVGGYGYVGPLIKVEFCARSTGEPAQNMDVTCDAAPQLPTVRFPAAAPRVMLAERTSWEKMTAIHVFCLQGNIRDHLSRHWYDIAKLDAAGHIEAALQIRGIAQQVVEHKSMFFGEKDAQGNWIDYSIAINGGLILVPAGEALETLELDYRKMIENGLFFHDPESFKWVIERCAEIQRRANTVGAAAKATISK